jgi:uncharacterized protein
MKLNAISILLFTGFLLFSSLSIAQDQSDQAPQLNLPGVPAAISSAPPAKTPAVAPVTEPKANNEVTQPSADTIQAKKLNFNDTKIVIGTGAVTGVYYPAGGAICRLVNKERQTLGLKCTIETTPGSIYNLQALKDDEVQLAIVQSDWQESAHDGTGPFVGKPIDNLKFLFSLHTEAMTMVVTQQSDIQKLDDIKGHKVNVGSQGSGVNSTMNEIFKAKGWSSSDFKGLLELKPNEQVNALCDGTIDVMILATGHPNGAVQDLVKACDVRFIDIDDPDIEKLVNSNPEYSLAVIPGGIYPGIPKDTKTFGVEATVVALSTMSDDMAYTIVRLVFDNLDAFKTLHPVFSQLEAARMATEGKAVPYHPGALKYYQEKGFKLRN